MKSMISSDITENKPRNFVIYALPAAMSLSEQYSVDMPIVFGVDKIVNQGVSAKDVAKELLERELSAEVFNERLASERCTFT